jgi:inhibitor of KinA sporulation pathway (predicted exonuclease)
MSADLSRIIVVDVEATCWSTREEQGTRPNEIIEIGAAQLNLKSGEITDRISIAVKPEFTEISAFCAELTGWTQETIDAEGLPIYQALDEFQAHFNTDRFTMWASYGDYDRQMLMTNTRKGIKLYDMLKNGKRDNPFDHMHSHLNVKTLFGLKHKLKRECGMEKALQLLNLPLEGKHHNGGDDAYNIAKILRQLLS